MGGDKGGSDSGAGHKQDATAICPRRALEVLHHLAAGSERLARLLDRILSLSIDHFYLFDRTGKLLYVNLPAATALGLEREAIVGRRWQELGFSPEATQQVEAQVQRVFASNRPAKGSVSLPTPGGTRSFEYVLTPNEAGSSARAVVAALTDVTERRLAEAEREQLLERLREVNQELVATSLREQESAEEARSRAAEAERAVRMRDEFLSSAAHELKTPLTSLRGFSQAITRKRENGNLEEADLIRALKHIDRQTLRLANLAEQLLDVSNLEAGKLVVAPEETELSSVVDLAIRSIREVHPHRDFRVRDPASVRAYVDPSRMGKVIANLVDNAAKFSPPDTPVEIDLAMDWPEQVTISVRDYGSGIPENDRPRMFERFYQIHPKDHYGGIGLGLCISAQIAELHGGAITYEAPEGGGSRFVVHLPVKA